jgi:hypothetical protein
VRETLAAQKEEESLLRYIQKILSPPCKEKEPLTLKSVSEEAITKDETHKGDTMEMVKDCISSSHQVLDEGINNTFILENSLFQDEEKRDGCWGLDFDGAHSSSGSGIGVVLISPDKETTLFSYRLEFNCTNNIAEYEALILGMNLAIDMNIKSLHVRGDSDLIVSQINRNFSAKNPRLKQVQRRCLGCHEKV